MSVNSQDTYVNILTPLTVVGSGGGGAVSSFSTIFVSTANVDYLNTIDITNFFLSTQIIEAEEAFISSISTFGLYLDGSLLTTVANELLLNGIPIATTTNISSLADWSYDPAVSTLNMNGNSSINATLTSTNVIQANSGFINNLVCSDISTVTLTVISTLHNLSTISSLVIEAQAGFFSTINGVTFPQNTVSAETGSISSLTTSSLNGFSYPPPNSDVSQWATFPAVSTITGGMGATDDLRIAVGRNLGIESRVSTGIVIDRGIDIGGAASFNVLTKNGNRGQINLTSDPGFGGIFGEINLTANGGTTPGLVASGGLIQLTANTPVGTLPTATSAIKFSAAGINSYAGAIPSIGSLLGYNFIYGTLGVNLCAGLPPTLPNTPGTTYLYGTSGITLGSQTNTGSDITQSAGGLYTTLVTGYWAGGIFSPQDLIIRGRQIPVYGNSYVQLSNVGVLSFDSGAAKAITGLSTINGAAYPPPGTSIPANLAVSSLTAAIQVSTPALFVSSVNGGVYPPPAPPVVIPADLVVSTLTAASQVSTQALFVSSVNGSEYPPNATVSANLVVSTLVAANNISTNELFVSTLTGHVANISSLAVSSIVGNTVDVRRVIVNGVGSAIILEQNPSAPITSYPIIGQANAAGGISTQTQHLALLGTNDSTAFTPQFYTTPTSPSTIGHLGANILYLGSDTIHWATVKASGIASTIIMSGTLEVSSLIGISTINGAAYPPAGSLDANLIVSTLTAAQYVSTPELFVSSVNGSEYPPVVSVPADLTVSTLTLPTDGLITFGGDTTISHAPSGTININATSAVNISTVLTVLDIQVSSINGAVYPPAGSGAIQSTIANSGSFIDINSAGAISSFSGGRTEIVAGSGGVNLLDSDNNASILVSGDIVMNTTFGGAVKIDQGDLYVSSIFISSVNGGLYPPPSAGGSPNGEFSTITVSSFASLPQVTNVSSINDVNFNGGDIGAQNVSAEIGFNLAGAGTFTINGATGAEKQVIQIIAGYPAWATFVTPTAHYSSMTDSLVLFSTFSTIIERTFTTQTGSGNCLITGTVTVLNGATIGDNLTTWLSQQAAGVPLGIGTALSTTAVYANGYQNISIQYLIPQATLEPPGTPNILGIIMRKPDTDNGYTVTNANITITTDLN